MSTVAASNSGGPVHRLSEVGRVVHEGLVFPEGPRWHDDRLWVSDMHAHRVIRIDPTGAEAADVVVEDLGDKSSGLGFLPDGTLLVVAMVSRRLMKVDMATREVSVHADLSAISSEFTNDLVVDAQGRAYVGSRNVGGGAAGPEDTIIMVEPDGRARVVADGLQGPNGMVIDDAGSMLVVAETPLGRLTRFEITADGSLQNRSVFAQFSDLVFDGICLDAEGMIWGATGSGTRGCVRVAPGGEIVESVVADGDWIVACMLGGVERRELFLLLTHTSMDYLKKMGVVTEVAAASEGRKIERRAEATDECSAKILAATVGVPGAGFP